VRPHPGSPSQACGRRPPVRLSIATPVDAGRSRGRRATRGHRHRDIAASTRESECPLLQARRYRFGTNASTPSAPNAVAIETIGSRPFREVARSPVGLMLSLGMQHRDWLRAHESSFGSMSPDEGGGVSPAAGSVSQRADQTASALFAERNGCFDCAPSCRWSSMGAGRRVGGWLRAWQRCHGAESACGCPLRCMDQGATSPGVHKAPHSWLVWPRGEMAHPLPRDPARGQRVALDRDRRDRPRCGARRG
jgi:hypothetical protein